MLIFVIILVGMVALMVLEKMYPHCNLPRVPGWHLKTICLNMVQLLIAMWGHYAYDNMFGGFSLVKLDVVNPFVTAILAYIVNSWFLYWWHRLRHEKNFLWLLLHQVHHSPTRMQVWTAFYKHPLESISNFFIVLIISNPILGLKPEASIYVSALTAFNEFFYHLNIKTPHWIGYFVQRPESHRLHHLQNIRFCKNYGDLPIWDILGGTFENPGDDFIPIGFTEDREQKLASMLIFQDVLHDKPITHSIRSKDVIVGLLLLLGCLQTIGYITNSPGIKGIGFATVASPLPLVFSVYNGQETFCTTFEIKATMVNGSIISVNLDNKLYAKLRGPYNRRNVYGALFAYGPFFNLEPLEKLRQSILIHGICERKNIPKPFWGDKFGLIRKGLNSPLIKELDLSRNYPQRVDIVIRSKTKGNENKTWMMNVIC